jgi:hypothetical protein
MMATGMSRWNATIAMVEEGADPKSFELLDGIPKVFVRHYEDVLSIERILRLTPGTIGPDAERTLNAWLRDQTLDGDLDLSDHGWVGSLANATGLHVTGNLEIRRSGVTELPEGLVVDGDICLSDSLDIRTIPANVSVGGSLDLYKSGVETLSTGLKVGANLDLRSSRWDGKIPTDAVIGCEIATDEHETWISLSAWRELHPDGKSPR